MSLSFEVVAAVEELLAEGRHSQREIALKVGVSRGSVANIFHGRRAPLPEDLANPLHRPIAKCPACGCRVTLPCQACRARRYQEDLLAGKREPPALRETPGAFGEHLTAAELARLEEVRRAKIPPALYRPLHALCEESKDAA